MEIDNKQDIIDSRDILERIEELENDSDLLEYEQEELKILIALSKKGQEYAPDWEYGSTLIRDTYFEEYAKELAEDCGMLEKEYRWPANHIDWDAAAEELQMDYILIDFDGVEYWVR